MSDTTGFEIRNLKVSVEDKQILKGVSLKIGKGEVHALMGRNGTGKTTLANSLMGHPNYKIDEGKVFLNGEDVTDLSPDERAKKRMFLAFQYPVAIPGVTVANFLRTCIQSVRSHEVKNREIRKLIKQEIEYLNIPDSFMTRSLNDGFSGGEKKRIETLQMRLLQPQMTVLDETDSGLDIDALKAVSEGIEGMRDGKKSFLVITHYQRMLDYFKPDYVHVLHDGKIVKSGGPELAHELEKKGYEEIVTE